MDSKPSPRSETVTFLTPEDLEPINAELLEHEARLEALEAGPVEPPIPPEPPEPTPGPPANLLVISVGQSINQALAQAKSQGRPGVGLNAGTYEERVRFEQPGMALWAMTPRTVKIYPQAQAGALGIHVNADTCSLRGGILCDFSRVDIHGLGIKGAQSHHFTAEDLEIWGCKQSGIISYDSASALTLRRIHVHHVGTTQYHHGAYVKGRDNVIEDFVGEDLSGYALHVWASDGDTWHTQARRITGRRCRTGGITFAHGNNQSVLEDFLVHDNAADGVYMWGNRGAIIRRGTLNRNGRWGIYQGTESWDNTIGPMDGTGNGARGNQLGGLLQDDGRTTTYVPTVRRPKAAPDLTIREHDGREGDLP